MKYEAISHISGCVFCPFNLHLIPQISIASVVHLPSAAADDLPHCFCTGADQHHGRASLLRKDTCDFCGFGIIALHHLMKMLLREHLHFPNRLSCSCFIFLRKAPVVEPHVADCGKASRKKLILVRGKCFVFCVKRFPAVFHIF